MWFEVDLALFFLLFSNFPIIADCCCKVFGQDQPVALSLLGSTRYREALEGECGEKVSWWHLEQRALSELLGDNLSHGVF